VTLLRCDLPCDSRHIGVAVRIHQLRTLGGFVAYKLSPDMMELSEAALDAHGRIFLGTLQMSPDSLDVIATALSGHMTVFGFSGPQHPLRELSENDYSKGAFRRGATRFEFRDGGESIVVLAVRKIDYERVLKMLTPPRGDPKLGPRPR
jgi:hypothetical protein